MVSKKTFVHRLFNQTFKNTTIRRVGSPPGPNKTTIAPDPGDAGVCRRFLHRGTSFNRPPELRWLPMALGNLREQLASIGAGERSLLDGLRSPAGTLDELTVDETRKLVRAAEVVKLKARLKEIPASWITYEEYVGICRESCSDGDRGLELAKRLDGAGEVIVFGSVVFLRPDQVAKLIAELISLPEAMTRKDATRNKELEEMEEQKAEIDRRAGELVRRELWWGLGFLVAQTATFMRLTFWDLSWDVMEPICYYVTSTYFMGGYAFFLTTSKEPSFEGLYHSRFHANQKRLMKVHNFDVQKYSQLQRALGLDQKTRV